MPGIPTLDTACVLNLVTTRGVIWNSQPSPLECLNRNFFLPPHLKFMRFTIWHIWGRRHPWYSLRPPAESSYPPAGKLLGWAVHPGELAIMLKGWSYWVKWNWGKELRHVSGINSLKHKAPDSAVNSSYLTRNVWTKIPCAPGACFTAYSTREPCQHSRTVKPFTESHMWVLVHLAYDWWHLDTASLEKGVVKYLYSILPC